MRRMARRLVLSVEIVGAVMAALLVAGVLFVWYVNTNDYRKEVAAAIGQATGLVVAIDGSLRFTLTPLPAMIVHDLRVANPPWSERAEMARVAQLEVRFSPVDLLAGRNHLPKVSLSGAEIYLEADGHGRANWWQELRPGEGPYPPPDIDRLEMVSSRIDFIDDATRRTVKLEIDEAQARLPRNGAFSIEGRGAYFGTPFTGSLTGGRYADLVGDRPLWPAVVRLQGAEATFEGRGTLDRAISEQIIDMVVTLSGQRVSALASAVAGAALPDIGPYSVSGRLSGGWSHYRLGDIRAGVAGSDVVGDLTVVTGPSRPRLEGKLRSQVLRPQDFFGPVTASVPPLSAADGRILDPRPLPFAALAGADVRLDVTIDRLAAQPLELFDVEAAITLANGGLIVHPLRAKVGGGRIDATVEADAGQPPALHISGRGDGLVAEEVLPALGMALSPTGPFSLALDLAGHGPSFRDFLGHADGRVRLTIGPGTLPVRQFDLIASDLVQAAMPWATRHGERTELNCVATRLKIADGVANVERLLIDTTKITVTGLGEINFNTEQIDLKLDPRPKDPSLISLATRMRLSGSFTEYGAAPDAMGLAKGAAAGVALAIGELNPLAFMLPFVSIGTGVANPCQEEIADRPLLVRGGLAPHDGVRGLLDGPGRVMTVPAESKR